MITCSVADTCTGSRRYPERTTSQTDEMAANVSDESEYVDIIDENGVKFRVKLNSENREEDCVQFRVKRDGDDNTEVNDVNSEVDDVQFRVKQERDGNTEVDGVQFRDMQERDDSTEVNGVQFCVKQERDNTEVDVQSRVKQEGDDSTEVDGVQFRVKQDGDYSTEVDDVQSGVKQERDDSTEVDDVQSGVKQERDDSTEVDDDQSGVKQDGDDNAGVDVVPFRIKQEPVDFERMEMSGSLRKSADGKETDEEYNEMESLPIHSDADENEEFDFEGFTLNHLVNEEESDEDLELVVHQQDLLQQTDSDLSDSCSSNQNEVGGEDDDSYVLSSDADLSDSSGSSQNEVGGEDDDSLFLPSGSSATDLSDSSGNNQNETGGDEDTGPSCAKKQRRMTKKQRDTLSTQWSSKTRKIDPITKFDQLVEEGKVKVGVDHDLPVDAAPYDYFTLLLPESFWATFAEETNKHARQKQEAEGHDKIWKETTADEMKIFIFVQFMFGIHILPETKQYWSTDPLLRVSAIADVISKRRFEKLSQYFHLNDSQLAVPKGQPGYDHLFKVRPLFDVIADNSRAHFFPGQNISIDEAMINFNGRLNFKQSVKGKRNPWGIKLVCAADPLTGYMLEFDVYQGHFAAASHKGVDVVMKMANRFLDTGRHMFVGDCFSSVELGRDLEKRDTFICSAFRLHRRGWPKDLNAQRARKMKPGSARFRQDGNMVATLWKDKRPVAVLSTMVQPQMGETWRKAPGGKRRVAVPVPVLTYNQSKGGVDLADRHYSCYPVGRPSVRWWRYLCWWLLQTAMVNAFIIWKLTHRPAPSKEGLRHIDFRLAVLQQLCRGKSTLRPRLSHQVVSQAGLTSPQPLQHVIERCPGSKQNCLVCAKAKARTEKGYGVKTVWGCLVCRVHLCKGHCFVRFHQQLAQSITK